MPPLDEAEYLVEHLWEVGPTMAAGAGAGPVTFQEMTAWQEMTGVDLEPWEARILRQLSLDYLSESHKAESPDRLPPYGALQRNSSVDDKLDKFLD
jgi:hypothetical protein